LSGTLTGDEREAIALAVWPELSKLGVGYLLGHGIIVECVVAGDPKAPVDELTRARILEAAARIAVKVPA
jgi:hypothetical protein